MPIPFNPPNLPLAYPENSVDKLNRTFDLINTYAKNRREQNTLSQTQQLAQQAKDIEMAKGLAGNGQDFLDAYNKIVAARTPAAKVPFSTPPAPSALGGINNPDTVNPAGNTQPGSPIIDHWNASMGSQTAGVEPPATSTGTMVTPKPVAPQTFGAGIVNTDGTIDPIAQQAFLKQHGPIGWDKFMKTATEQNTLKTAFGKTQPVPVMTKEDAIKAGKVDPGTKIVEPSLALSEKQTQFDQKEWDKIVKDANPLTASSRSTLGMASKANFQADRALVTLSKPVVTNQEAGNAMADIAAIYQTGSPTQYGMSHQEYSTLYGKIQGALQTVTGKPQDALPDAIKQRLVGVLHDMKGTNGQVLKQQLDFIEKAKSRIIKKFPQEWQDIRSTLESNPDSPGQSAIPQTGPHGASVSQNGHTYNWNPRTGQYE